MKIFVFHLLTLVALVGCMPGKSNLQITMPKKGAVTSTVSSASISSVQVINNQLVINGNGFSDVTNVKVNGHSLNENFTIESKTATKIIANSIRAFSFDVSKVFSLILSDANASATFAIDFSLCNATLNGKGFNCAAPVADKDVLAYDAVSGTWKPRPASGLNYLGTFDASSNPGAGPAIQPAGAYYVISDDGTIAAVSFAVGDWLVSNGSTWQKIDNSSAVLSVHGRYGAITAQQGDYTLDLLGDVSFPTAPVAGKVLKFDGTNWVASDDLSGGGAGSVTSATIADGTIMNADINAGASIDYSKLNIPNTTIPYAKLNIADGAIPVAKISGIPAVTSVLSTSITNGDTTHAPNGDVVYDALALKLGVNGGALTSGTISGLPTPVGPTEAASKSYVDSEIAGITGFSEAAVLGTDLAGLNTGVNGPITAADTVLGAFGKMQYQVTDLKAKGLWDKTVNDIAYTAGNVSIDKKLRLKSDNANYVEILSPTSLATTYTLTLPANDGNADQVLKTNGTGTLSWADLTDTGVQAFAKTALPTCGASEVLKSNGTSFSCVTDASVPAFTGTANRAVATTGAGGSLAVQAVTSTELGYLSGVTSAIQTQLNGKEGTLTAGTSAQYYRGDKTWATLNSAAVPELTNLYFTQARAIASPLTGVSSTAGTITAADTILGAFGKLLNTQTDYVSKTANSTITGTLTINSIVGALKVPPPVNVDDAVPKSYVDGFGQWTKSGSDLYRSDGVIGLGTTTPDRRLTIIGDGTNYGDDIYVEAVNSETAVAQISLTRSRGTTTTRNPVLANDILGVLAYRGNDTGNASTFPSSARIISQAETDFATAVNGNLVFQTNAAGTLSEKMRITSTGRVGVGTTTPGAMFEMSSTTPSLRITNSNVAIPDYSTAGFIPALGANTTAQWVNYSNSNGGYQLAGFTKAGVNTAVPAAIVGYHGGTAPTAPAIALSGYKWDGATSRAALAATESVMQVLNGATPLMTVSGAGNVGIGATAPLTSLHIVSTQPSTEVHPNRAGILLEAEGTSVGGRIAAKVSSDTESPLFVGYRSRGTKAAPTGLLSGDQITAVSPVGYDGAGNWQTGAHIRFNTTENWSSSAIGSAISFRTPSNGTTSVPERMRIDHNGNVGIGTSAPAANLHITGNVDGDVTSYITNTDDTGTLSRSMFLVGTISSGLRYGYLAHHGAGFVASGPYKPRTTVLSGNDTGGLNFNGNSQLGFWVSTSEKMKILSNGNVGIGTSTPAVNLDVTGAAKVGSGTTARTGDYLSLTTSSASTKRSGIQFYQNGTGLYEIGIDHASNNSNTFFIHDSINNANRFAIGATGNVGIGNAAPDEKFVVFNGTTTGKYTTGGWTHSSDARLKHDIHTITNATEKILKLRGVDYIFNNDSTNERQLGFIAQEVEPLFPQVVKTDKDGYKSMVYANLVAPLVEAFKDLYKKVTDIFMTTEKNTRAIASVNLKVKKLEEENAAKTKEIAELKAYLCAKDPEAKICK